MTATTATGAPRRSRVRRGAAIGALAALALAAGLGAGIAVESAASPSSPAWTPSPLTDQVPVGGPGDDRQAIDGWTLVPDHGSSSNAGTSSADDPHRGDGAPHDGT